MNNALSVTNLVKKYSDSTAQKYAIDDLTLQVPKGSIFGLLGPNGAGKSTLINILAGTVIKDQGTVDIMGVSIDQYPKKARSLIGIVPQEIVYDSFFTLYQALELYAGYYGIRPKERKTDDLLKALSLWDKRDMLPQKLSGGMKRRFLIAKAMVHSPKLLILDEPTAGVDLELRQQLWNYVKQLNSAYGVTIIITTHYLAEAQELCDEIAFIGQGKILKQATKSELFRQLGAKYIDIEIANLPKLETLQLAPELKPTLIGENILRLEVHEQNINYNQVLQQLIDRQLDIKDIKIQEVDLENIFYKIVHQA